MVDIIQSFRDHDNSKIETYMLENIKKGKEPEQLNIIDKYGIYFVEEFKHFLKIHGFVQPGKMESQKQVI